MKTPKTHLLPKIFLKALPLLLSTFILASFLTQHPDTALSLLDQALKRMGLIRIASLSKDEVLPTSISFVTPPTDLHINQPDTQNPKTTPPKINYYTGVELWQEIQEYRRQHGVPEFKQDNVLCTIASIRINQLLTLNDLDNHDGFSPLIEKFRENGQLTHHNVAENILSGYPTAQEAVDGWDSSLGHQSLMQDGSYVYACAAANSGFAALVAAY